MLNIKTIREKTNLIKKSIEKRGLSDKNEIIDTILNLDKRWRILKQRSDKLRNKRNELTNKIRELKSQGNKTDLIIKQAKEIPRKIEIIESEAEALQQEIRNNLIHIPNLLHGSVPKGKDEKDNIPFKFWGKPEQKEFECRTHTDLLEKTGLANFEAGRKNSGKGFNYILGDLALLDLALQKYGVDFLVKKGFIPIISPLMLNKETLNGTAVFNDFEDVIYKIEKEDLYLIATGEHPLVSLYKNRIFNKEELPIKLCTITPCFRKEVGGHGVDMKGLFRMHQFNKVEQVIICTQEDSNKYFELMENITEEFLKKLKIPFRVTEICSGDLGQKFSRQWDQEAWFPRQKKYAEIGSCGNTTEYQAVDLNIRYQDGEKKKYVHMLNNTMVATSRVMVAIIENFQKKDGSITIPKVLRRYMFRKNKIGGYKNSR